MNRYYISFAQDRFLGATVVDAVDEADALNTATALNLNPGGEAAIWRVPIDDRTTPFLNRLATKEEVEAAGHLSIGEESPANQRKVMSVAAVVCADCNSGKPHRH